MSKEEGKKCLRAFGSAIRGDWMDIDGRSIRDSMDDLCEVLDGHMTYETWCDRPESTKTKSVGSTMHNFRPISEVGDWTAEEQVEQIRVRCDFLGCLVGDLYQRILEDEIVKIHETPPRKPMDSKVAFNNFCRALMDDPEWSWSWHCNLACMLLDEGVPHANANERAASFMKTAFGVDVSKFEQYETFCR